MRFISYISVFMIPVLILYILGYGLIAKRNIYGDFLEGAEEGLKIVWRLVPTLIGLMTSVGVLRASGFLDFLGSILSKASGALGIAPELFPLGLVRLFSSSAATGLLLDIFKQFGTDSPTGLMAALMLSATESVFYCMSVYFGSVGVQKSPIHTAGGIACLTCRDGGCCVHRSIFIVNFMADFVESCQTIFIFVYCKTL